MAARDDSQDLATFGYRQELDRKLGSFSSFATGFSYISILTGLFQTFALGFGAGHEAFIWSWPMVVAGQFLVALGFAELAAHYPLSGGAYQWSKMVGSPFLGWIVGWTYISCLIVTLAAVALALQSILPQISAHFQFAGESAVNAVLLGCGLLLVTTWLNSAGVGLLTRVNNLGVFTELIGVLILIAALAVRAVRPMDQVLFPPAVAGRSFLAPLLVSAAMTASYVLYGFDTAGSLAEETKNPRRNAPRGILRALAAASGLGMLVLLVALMAAGNLRAAELSRADGGLAWLVKSVLGERFGTLLLCDVVFAIMVCALAVHAGAVRLIFAMARDGKLPFSVALARVSPGSRTPVVPAIVTGGLAILILAVNVNLPRLIQLVTMVAVLWANLAYLFVTVALFRRRISGWPASEPHRPGSFSLGRWGIPVNLTAAAWSAFMVLNVGWPRAEIYGAGWSSRFAPILLTGILLSAGVSSYYFLQKQLKPAASQG
ncbi:MAG TPA: APC family permease [Bryobacteraceae bacterium]|jgi:urea carboxylase system permease|nr:APC family permease [Bryobacteraceae bacterium]